MAEHTFDWDSYNHGVWSAVDIRSKSQVAHFPLSVKLENFIYEYKPQ